MNRRKTSLCIILLLLAAIGMLVYGALVGRTRLEETHVLLSVPEWQAGSPEVKLAVLTDTHAMPWDGAYMERIVRTVLAGKPDAVLLLGDYLNGRPGRPAMEAEQFGEYLRPLAALPCFVVLGNHDYYHGSFRFRRIFRQLGMKMLEGRREDVQLNGQKLSFGGVRCLCTFRTPGRILPPVPGRPYILLSHTPLGADYAPPGTLITLAGHTHGGQVCLPGGKSIIRPDADTPRWRASGLHRIGEQWEYVSRGLGTSILPIRLFCRPELLWVTLRPGNTAPSASY